MGISLHGKPASNGDTGKVSINGDTVAEVNSSQAKAFALQAGKSIMSRPGISGQSGPYPVDPDTGEAYDNPLQGLKAGTTFRQDFDLRDRF